MDSRYYFNCQNNFTFPVKTQEAEWDSRAGLHHTACLVLLHSNHRLCLKFCKGLQQPCSSADPVTPLVPPSRAATSQPCSLNSISVYILTPGLSLLQVRGMQRDFAGTNITTNADNSGEMDNDVQGYNTFLILNLNWSSLCCTTAKYFSQNSLDLLTNSLLLTGYRGWVAAEHHSLLLQARAAAEMAPSTFSFHLCPTSAPGKTVFTKSVDRKEKGTVKLFPWTCIFLELFELWRFFWGVTILIALFVKCLHMMRTQALD